MPFPPRLLSLIPFIVIAIKASTILAQSTSAPQQAVATVHPLATDAALAAYTNGGNAIDAAIAAALTLGVADSHNSGIGGGCFILIHAADVEGKCEGIDGDLVATGG
jgi:gamma-glutamyltranspeptidase/glutathione hydrolase